MNKSYEGKIIDAKDGSGDGILIFPQEMIDDLGWKEGDVLDFSNEDGNIILKNLNVAKKQQNEDSA